MAGLWTIRKRLEISSAHRLHLDYESKCTKVHGHNWIITVEVSASKLDKFGMVIDFGKIKEVVNQLDHQYLNDLGILAGLPNMTAEWIARWVHDRVKDETQAGQFAVVHVTVQETEGNEACYTE